MARIALRQLPMSEASSAPESITRFGEKLVYFPEPSEIIYLHFRTEEGMPTSKGTRVYGDIEISVNGVSSIIPAGFRVQGGTSAKNRIKNWNIFFYGETEPGSHSGGKKWVKFGDQIPCRKFAFKADQTDGSKLRTPLALNIWENLFVRSRTQFPQYEVDNQWLEHESLEKGMFTGATGIPRSQPAILYINGDFYSIGNLKIQKEWYNYNMPRDDNSVPYIMFRKDAWSWKKLDDDGFTPSVSKRIPRKEWSEDKNDALRRLSKFFKDATTSSDSDFFRDNYDKYFDKINIVDFTLWSELIHNFDNMNEVIFITYNQKIWYAQPWDVDTTFGLYRSHSSAAVKMDPETWVSMKDDNVDSTNRPSLWNKAYGALEGDFKDRWSYLRDNGYITLNSINAELKKIAFKFASDLYDLQEEEWGDQSFTGKPNLDKNGAGQIMQFVEKKLAMMDKELGYDPEN